MDITTLIEQSFQSVQLQVALNVLLESIIFSDCYIREFVIIHCVGGVVKDQATADPDSNFKQRAAIAVGSTAAGVQDATDNEVVKVVAKAVEKGAEKAEEKLADDNSDNDK